MLADVWIADAGGTAVPLGAIALRFFAACVLGGVIGFEREVRSKPAGLRTHILVALTAAAFTVITFEVYDAHLSDGQSRSDPLRLVEAIVAGVGFLGGGAILRDKDGVQGITTGAGIWAAGAIGFGCGLGYLVITGMMTLFCLVVLGVLGRVEKRVINND